MLPPPRLAADVFETPDGTAYAVEVPVPGLTADELIVTASGDMLTVEVQPKASTDGQSRRYLVQEVPRRVPKAGGARSRVITLRE